MMPGYRDALLAVDYNTTGQDYTALAQTALDDMAYEIQTFYLGYFPPDHSPEVDLTFPTGGETLNSSDGNVTITFSVEDPNDGLWPT